ncbi:trans-sialidase [Trypanosoma cruzi]|nr:trans-sialidase [Trypanosoma cruzi]
MLTGHVDCECLLTASISLSLFTSLSFPVGCGVLHGVRAGPPTPTARRDLPRWPVRSGGARCLISLLGLLSLFPLPLEHRHARKESKQALLATVKFEGTERTNSTHTNIYMLSRVAAVKAPRTHNRRRVTGSSGRRREGGESERHRPNMSRHVFTSTVLLLLFVMMCCGSGAAAASTGEN